MPTIPASTRIGVPAIISSAIHTVQKITVCPKSGCNISSTATIPVIAPVMSTVGSSCSLTLSDRTQATATMNRGLRNSDGWNSAMPTPIQRRAPLCTAPMNGVTASRKAKSAAPLSASRRAVATGSIDTPNSTGSDTPTHISWRQK